MNGSQINLTLHTRPITHVKYNYDSDLFFASSHDSIISLWNTEGNLKGTYNGNETAVTCMDENSNNLLSGSSDRNVILWDIMSGKQRLSIEFNSTIKSVNLNENNLLICCDDSYNNKPTLNYYDLRQSGFVFFMNF